MEPGAAFFITPADLRIDGKNSGLIRKSKFRFYPGAGIEAYRCVNGQAALADVHHLAWYLYLAIDIDKNWNREWAAKVSPIISNDQAQSGLQNASDLFLVEWLWY